MKNLIFIPILLFSVVTIFAQSNKFNFMLGAEYKLPKKFDDYGFWGNSRDGILNTSLKDNKLNILRFDTKTLNQTSENTFETTEGSRYYRNENFIDLGNNYYWFHSDYIKDDKQEVLFYDKVDIQSGKIIESNHKIIEAGKLTIDKYHYQFDAAQKKLLIYYRLYPEVRNDKKNYDKIGVYIFDDQMNKIWNKEYTMPYTEAVMDNLDFSVDNNGNAYLLAKVYNSDDRNAKDPVTNLPAYHYELLKFIQGSSNVATTIIDIGSKFVKRASLLESSQNEMFITCLYSNKANTTGVDGIYLNKIDKDGKLVKFNTGYFEFPLDEMLKYESKRSKKVMEKRENFEIPSLSIKAISLDEKGNIFFAFEQAFTRTSSYKTSTTYYTYTDYYYQDIYAAKISGAGNFEWMRKIPKAQEGKMGPGGLSYKLIIDSSGYYFLYVDNKKNMELALDEVPATHKDGKGGQVVVAKLDTNGELTKEIIFDTKDEDIMIFPTQLYKINGNQLIGRAAIHGRGGYKPILIAIH